MASSKQLFPALLLIALLCATSVNAGPAGAEGGPGQGQAKGRFDKLKNEHTVEGGAFFLLLVIACTLLMGSRYNKKVVSAWAETFTSPGSLFDKSFTQLGPPNTEGASPKDMFIHESSNLAKFYCSGRRHIQGVLVTLALKARHDAASVLWSLIEPTEDQLQVEVYMNEYSMQPMALAVATPKFARHMQKDWKDLQLFTKKITISKDQMSTWPHEKLHVLAEHSSHFYDLFSENKVNQLFDPIRTPEVLKYFRSLHFTSDSGASQKQVLRFVFALPSPANMGELNKLLGMVPLFIDAVGNFKLSADLKKRALDTRANAEGKDEEEDRKKRVAATQAKKEEKLRIARMTPEAQAKYQEKQVKQQMKKTIKS